MAITQEVIILNEGLEERRRTTGAGTKSRYTLSVDAQPILHEFAEEKLGEEPAQALFAAIRSQIKGITEIAKPLTLRARQTAKRALARSASWAVSRYAGGRTGETPPSGSVRLFNDSGRLADGLFVRQNTTEKNWTINVPANRLDPSTFKRQGDFIAMVERLRSMVPALTNPLGTESVRHAIESGVRNVLIKEMKRNSDLRLARARAVLSLLGI